MKHLKLAFLAIVASVAAVTAAASLGWASAGDNLLGTGNSVGDSTLGTALGSYSSSEDARRGRGRDILVLAKDDIDTYRATGQASEFLQQVVSRLAKMNRTSETQILLDLKK